MRTSRPAATGRFSLALLVLVAAVASCGGADAGTPPRVWAAAVCTALAPWRAEIRDLTRSTQQQMTARTTPAQAQENLVRLMDGARQASEDARRKVADAGIPDATRGEAVSRSFVTSLAKVRDAYGRARGALAGLDTSRPSDFYDQVGTVMERLNQEYNASALDTTGLDSVELRRAFDEVPECR